MTIIKLVEKVIAYFSEIAIFLLGIAALALLVVIFREEGLLGVWETIRVDVTGIAIKFVLILIIFFVITGSINHLYAKHPKTFEDIIAGKHGVVTMLGLSSAMTGPAGAQQLHDEWNKQGVNKTNVLLCLTSMMALGVNIFIFRAKVLGGPLTLIWVGMGLIFLAQVWVVCKFANKLNWAGFG